MTNEQLNIIHQRGDAILNKIYTADSGKQYIGIPEGRLKVIDKASITSFRKSDNSKTNVQDEIESFDSELQTIRNNLLQTNILISTSIGMIDDDAFLFALIL